MIVKSQDRFLGFQMFRGYIAGFRKKGFGDDTMFTDHFDGNLLRDFFLESDDPGGRKIRLVGIAPDLEAI